MSDAGHRETEALIAEMEARISAEYAAAVRDVQAKLTDYLRRFRVKDEIWRKRVAAGEVTQAEYLEWRKGQIIMQRRWEALRDGLARDLHNANALARSIVDGYMPDIYAVNFNFGTYQIEHGGEIDTNFTLYSRETVERIIRDNPDLLPPPGKRMTAILAANKDIAWQKGQIQSVILQAILQG